MNFDSSWDDADLPTTDVIGPLGLSLELDDHLVSGTVQIGYSTLDDKNLFRLTKHIDDLLELLRPTNKIKLYDADIGGLLGAMVIQNGTKVLPVSGSKARPVQFIIFAFLTTVTYELPGSYV